MKTHISLASERLLAPLHKMLRVQMSNRVKGEFFEKPKKEPPIPKGQP